MKTTLRLIALVGLLAAVAAATTAGKDNEWDELESLIENIDKSGSGDKKSAVVATTAETVARASTPQEPPHHASSTAASEKGNPCEGHVCGWGKECVVSKQGEPECDCIVACPTLEGNDPNDKVCSNMNETFTSLCDLYRERCLCKKKSKKCENVEHAKVHLEYLGECKQLSECTDELLAQFPIRMADWLFQVMRELKKRRELEGAEWEDLLAEAEVDDDKKHVYPVIWKFCDLDVKPHDKAVSHHELIPITAPVIPMESCIKPFLERCDVDTDGHISILEWGHCLGLKDGEIQERC